MHSWNQNSGVPFFSDTSSDEDEEELFNPTDLIQGIESAKNAETKQKLKRELVEKFLDLRRPSLEGSMLNFFFEDGVLECLLSFVHRCEEIVTPADLGELDAPVKKPTGGKKKKKGKKAAERPEPPTQPKLKVRTLGVNDPAQEPKVKRSFNVTELFVTPNDNLDKLIQEKLSLILKELFKVFVPGSPGNFHHFEKILDQLLTRLPVETTKLLISDGHFWRMLDYPHEQAVVDATLNIFCCEFSKQSDTITFYKALVENKVFDQIGKRIYGPTAQETAFPTAEFFTKLIDKLACFEMSGILFIGLCRSPQFVNGLFKVITQPRPNKNTPPNTLIFSQSQKSAAATVLRDLLLKSGETIYDQHDLRPLPNMLSAIHDKLHDYGKAHVTGLCRVLIASDLPAGETPQRYSSYTVRRPFGLYRFVLMEILADAVTAVPSTLNSVPPEMWRVLSTWFFEFHYNNLYGCLFKRFVQTMILEEHVESQKILFSKYKFLTKTIDHLKTTKRSGAKGFIIEIGNLVRLAAESQPMDGFLRHHVQSHEMYKAWEPKLREETKVQLKRYADLELMDSEEEEDEDFDPENQVINIDLGSAFARRMGFDKGPVEVVEKKQRSGPRKRNRKKKKGKGENAAPAKPVTTPAPAAVKSQSKVEPDSPVPHAKGQVHHTKASASAIPVRKGSPVPSLDPTLKRKDSPMPSQFRHHASSAEKEALDQIKQQLEDDDEEDPFQMGALKRELSKVEEED